MTMIDTTTPEPEPTPEESVKAEGTPPAPEFQAVSYDPMAALKTFHSSFGIKPFIEEDAYGRQKLIELRMRLIREESMEAVDELLDIRNGKGSMSRLAKELADVLVVVYGTADALDIPLYKVFAEVHRSNMSKLGPDGKPVLDRGGKILKGPNYSPADIESVLADGVSS